MGCINTVTLAAEDNAWQYELTPYFLAAGLNGDAGVRGVSADVDMSFSDIWDDPDCGLMGVFTTSKGRWTLGLEGVFFKLESDEVKSVTGPFGQVTVDGALGLTTEMSIYQGTVAYRVVDEVTHLDVLGALRYTKLEADAKVKLSTTPGIVYPGGANSARGDESWADAVVGLRVIHPVSNQVSLLGYADIGGGGSDLTYQFLAGVNWKRNARQMQARNSRAYPSPIWY
jgi:hypothetical protein